MKYHWVVFNGIGERTHPAVLDDTSAAEAAQVERLAACLFGPCLDVPIPGADGIGLTFDPHRGCALFVLHDDLADWGRAMLVLNVALTGRDRRAERQTLQLGQQLLRTVLATWATIEPAFDLLHIPERPALATVMLPADPAAVGRARCDRLADLSEALAAAWFSRAGVPAAG